MVGEGQKLMQCVCVSAAEKASGIAAVVENISASGNEVGLTLIFNRVKCHPLRLV